MIKTVTLSGAEVCVTGLGGQNAIVKNLSSGAVFASAGTGVDQGADGVAEIPAGSGEVLLDVNGTVYLKGTGSVQVTGTNYATPNFKQPSSGTSGGGSVSDVVQENLIWSFTGDHGKARISLSDGLPITENLTIEVCANYTSFASDEHKGRFFEATPGSVTALVFAQSEENFEYAINGVWTSGEKSGLKIAVNTTNTISLVISGSDQQLYCNSEYISSGTNNLADISSTERLKIVRIRDSMVSNRSINGTVFAVRIYDRALTPGEIAMNYASDYAKYF